MVSASVQLNFVSNKALLIMISLLTQECVLFFFFFFFCFQSPFTTKIFETKSLKPKGTRFSFNHYEDNVKKNDTLLFFFCLFLFLVKYIKS